METTYGTQLRQFAQSIDIVSPRLLKDILKMTYNYLEASPGIDQCGLLRRTFVDSSAGLNCYWHSNNETWSQSLEDEHGKPKSQAALAFLRQEPLWIVAKPGGELDEETEVQDLWGEIDETLPHFTSYPSSSACTAIYLPLASGPIEDPLGILDLQSKAILEPSETLKAELTRIANALSILCTLERTYVIQKEGTERAQQNLRELSQTPIPAEQSIFLATPGSGDEDVIGQIRDVLDDTCPQYKTHHWTYENRGGNVNEQIWEGLSKSELGICYFSEPRDSESESGPRFADNPNVAFEAGMLQAMERIPGTVLR
ncbi:MAG: hypothetical protein ACLF0P_13885, partial [Thermoanaerobaculia bacterium]